MIRSFPNRDVVVSILAAVAILSFGECAWGQDGARDGRPQVHCMLLNAESVRTFDVLLKLEKSYDIVSQELENQQTTMRLTWDRDAQKLLCNLKLEFTQFVADDQPPRKRVATSGFLQNGDQVKVAIAIGRVNAVKSSPSQIYSQYGVPDLRFAGVRDFPFPCYEPADPLSFESMLKRILVSKSNYQVESASSQSNSIRLSVTTHEPPGGRVLGRSLEWSIAADTLMPKQYREFLRWKDAGNNRKTPTLWERFEWEEYDGIYVPSLIVSDAPGTLGDLRFTVQKTAKLDWFSVNRELKDETFSVDSLVSLEEFQKRIDLSLINAASKKKELP